MAVKLNMKPLKGDTFQVEMDGDATVAALKAKLAEMKPEYPAAIQKLIYAGKILADEAPIKSLDIKPDGFIVVMVTKPAAAPTPTPAPRPAPVAPAPGPAPGPRPTPAAPIGGGGAAPPDGNMAGMAALLGGPAPNLPQVILDMKQSPRFKELIMVIAQEPRVIERMLPALAQKWPELHAAIQANIQGFMQWLNREAAQQVMLEQVVNDPNAPPELQQAIRENPAAAMELLARLAEQGGGGEGMEMQGLPSMEMQGGMPVPDQISPEDDAAIVRLTELGFEKPMATQAYFAADKNEQLAANLLLSSGGDDDMQT